MTGQSFRFSLFFVYNLSTIKFIYDINRKKGSIFMKKRTAAFFDIDGTIYRDNLMVEHFRTLVDFDLIEQEANAKRTYQDWFKRQGDYEDYMNAVVHAYVESLKHLTKTDVDFTGKFVIKKKADRVYKFTRSMIQFHREQGHLVIFISGSPDFLVGNMAKKYLADDFEASTYVYEGERFTGDIIPMWDSNSKDKAIDRFVEKYDIDLASSYSYGDTNGDFAMLKRVGNPVAINPAKEFLENIQSDDYLSKQAKIIVERKDTIYRFSPDQAMLVDL